MTDAATRTTEPVLVEPAELVTLLASADPPVLADVRWTLGGPSAEPDFLAGHLPGAHWVDLESALTSPPGAGGRHPLPSAAVFEAAMRRIGVGPDRLVVVYDGASSLAASRLWWLLTDAGHDRVRVLNGGFAAWQAVGGPIETGPATEVEPGDFVARPGQRDQRDAAAIAAGLDGAGPTLVDVRAAERFTGATEPIDPVAGHIPGAINRPSMENLDEQSRFRPPTEIAERYVGTGDDLVLYCGSGITAAHTLLALESAGITASLYPGSWSEWIVDPSRPVATGETP